MLRRLVKEEQNDLRAHGGSGGSDGGNDETENGKTKPTLSSLR